MLRKAVVLAALTAVAALAALMWIQPQTAAGRTVLVGIVAGALAGIGGLVWRRGT